MDDITIVEMGLTSPEVTVACLAPLYRSTMRLQKLDFISGSSRLSSDLNTFHFCSSYTFLLGTLRSLFVSTHTLILSTCVCKYETYSKTHCGMLVLMRVPKYSHLPFAEIIKFMCIIVTLAY